MYLNRKSIAWAGDNWCVLHWMQKSNCEFTKNLCQHDFQGDTEKQEAQERFLCRLVVEYFGKMLEKRKKKINDRFSMVMPCKVLDAFLLLFEVVARILQGLKSPRKLSDVEMDNEISLAVKAVSRRWNSDAKKHSPYAFKHESKRKGVPLSLRSPKAFFPVLVAVKKHKSPILMMVRILIR
jgi:hypothetical protein